MTENRLMRWIRRKNEILEAELIEDIGNAVVPMLNANERQSLESSVVVMSSDGIRWAKLWGAQPIQAERIGNTIFNTNYIHFGPMRPGMPPYVAYFDILNRLGEPMFGWARLNRPIKLVSGDTFQFAPGTLRIDIIFDQPGAQPTNALKEVIMDMRLKELRE